MAGKRMTQRVRIPVVEWKKLTVFDTFQIFLSAQETIT